MRSQPPQDHLPLSQGLIEAEKKRKRRASDSSEVKRSYGRRSSSNRRRSRDKELDRTDRKLERGHLHDRDRFHDRERDREHPRERERETRDAGRERDRDRGDRGREGDRDDKRVSGREVEKERRHPNVTADVDGRIGYRQNDYYEFDDNVLYNMISRNEAEQSGYYEKRVKNIFFDYKHERSGRKDREVREDGREREDRRDRDREDRRDRDEGFRDRTRDSKAGVVDADLYYPKKR